MHFSKLFAGNLYLLIEITQGPKQIGSRKQRATYSKNIFHGCRHVPTLQSGTIRHLKKERKRHKWLVQDNEYACDINGMW